VEPCKIEWLTVPAPDLRAAKSFFSEVFGFSVSEYSKTFWVFKAGNISGGLDQGLTVNSHGIGFSITVPDISRTLEAVVKHGGKILKAPYELGPGAGFCSQFADPNGNVLELYSNTLSGSDAKS
jgi:hypothetical protein